MSAILGIDPGLDGALALLESTQLLVWDTPTLAIEKAGKNRRVIDRQQLLALLRIAKGRGAVAVVERVGPRNTDGAVAAFTFGQSYEAILMGLAALEIPIVEHPTPQTWKRVMGLPKPATKQEGKGMSRARASEILPQHASNWPLVKHDGRAEAALIAEYGRRNYK